MSWIEQGAREPRDTTLGALSTALGVPPEALADDGQCIRSVLQILAVPISKVVGIPGDDPTLAELRDIVSTLPPERRAALPTLLRGLLGVLPKG